MSASTQDKSQVAGKPWVLIGSANGSTNLGDECMWLAAAQTLRAHLPHAPIWTDAAPGWEPPIPNVLVLPYAFQRLRTGRALSTLMPGRVGAFADALVSRPFRDQVARRRVRKELQDSSVLIARWREVIANSAALVFTGAGAINDDYSVHGVYSWALLSRIARDHEVPVLFLGQGVGPLEKRVNNEWAAKMFSSAKHVSVRADSSRRLLLEMKVPPAVVSVEPDWALALEGDADAERQAEILLRDLVSDERFVAFSIHRRASTSRKILRRLARQLESAAETARELGLRVVFIPNMTAGRYSDDRETARLVVRDWKPETRSNVAFWDYEGSPLVVKSALRRAEALFCTRYHPMVFALSEGTPAFGLSFDRYYDQKLQGISRFFDVKGNVFRFDDVSANWSELLIRSTDYAPSPLGSDIARTVRAPFEVFIETARTA